jgi:hypothetical protein
MCTPLKSCGSDNSDFVISKLFPYLLLKTEGNERNVPERL